MKQIKPYTIDDLAAKVKDREFFKSDLTVIQNELLVAEKKVKELKDREAEAAKKVTDLDKKILEIAKELKGE